VLFRSIVRQVGREESVESLIEEAKTETHITGNEYALVRFSDGNRYLVSGGSKGIEFAEGELDILYGHTHPRFPGSNIANNGASVGDYNALLKLGQSKSRVFYEGIMETIFNQQKIITDLRQVSKPSTIH
jgi:hypothetical protein